MYTMEKFLSVFSVKKFSGDQKELIMFGYVRAYKPYMRVFEYDIYKAVYCGLCKDMGRRYGFFTRFTLSYDFAFLSLIDLSVRDCMLDADMQRCVAHPLKKTMCATCKNDLSYSSSAAVILTYHKLRDDIADKDSKNRFAAMAALPFFKKPYEEASEKYPDLAPQIERAMILQNKIEHDKTASIDLACEPTAMMMTAVFGGLTQEPHKKALLERFGYLLGRYIYITDALDDVTDDYKTGAYNPLLSLFDVRYGEEKIPRDKFKKIRRYARESVYFTLGSLADVYVQLDFKRYRDILDNIIYLGLKNTFNSVLNGKFKNKYKRGNHIHE